MFTTIEDWASAWQQESGFTQSVMDALTDESLAQVVDEGHRNLGRMAWHTAMTIPEMMSHCGLDFGGADPKAPVAATAKEIAEAYRTHSQKLLAVVKSKWQDESLQVEEDLYGETWKRGKTLLILMMHEIHHRGQMTVLMRQAGLVVPSIYGPAKEGWAAYGTEPPAV